MKKILTFCRNLEAGCWWLRPWLRKTQGNSFFMNYEFWIWIWKFVEINIVFSSFCNIRELTNGQLNTFLLNSFLQLKSSWLNFSYKKSSWSFWNIMSLKTKICFFSNRFLGFFGLSGMGGREKLGWFFLKNRLPSSKRQSTEALMKELNLLLWRKMSFNIGAKSKLEIIYV